MWVNSCLAASFLTQRWGMIPHSASWRAAAVSSRVPGTLDAAGALRHAEALGLHPLELLQEMHRVHIFTHIRWEMTGYILEVQGYGPTEWLWADSGERRKRAVPSAFERFTREITEEERG